MKKEKDINYQNTYKELYSNIFQEQSVNMKTYHNCTSKEKTSELIQEETEIMVTNMISLYEQQTIP